MTTTTKNDKFDIAQRIAGAADYLNALIRQAVKEHGLVVHLHKGQLEALGYATTPYLWTQVWEEVLSDDRAAHAWANTLVESGAKVGYGKLEVLEMVLSSLAKHSRANLVQLFDEEDPIWTLLEHYEKGTLSTLLD